MSGYDGNISTTFRVSLESGEAFDCAGNEKVLIAMERASVTGIQVGCRGGGCGACRVEVLDGEYEILRMSKNHVSDDEAKQGFALACRVLPKSDLVMRVAQQSPVAEETQNLRAKSLQR